jgi:hypothetical protein
MEKYQKNVEKASKLVSNTSLKGEDGLPVSELPQGSQYLHFLHVLIHHDIIFQGPHLIKLQESIFPRFLKDNFGKQTIVDQWRQSVMEAATLSRLHLLLEILDSAIVWDKSAENVVSLLSGSLSSAYYLCVTV